MYRLTWILIVVATISALSGCGISGNLRNDPGFAAFKAPRMRDTNREFALSLGPLPLNLARKFMGDDPDITALLRGLKAVRLYIYKIDGDSKRVRDRMESIAARLTDQGWMPVVVVREDDGLTSALVRMDNQDQILGLAVIAQDDSELILINLIGRIQPEMFSVYLAELAIYVPDINIDPR